MFKIQLLVIQEERDRLRDQSSSRIPPLQEDFDPVHGLCDSWEDVHMSLDSPQVFRRKVWDFNIRDYIVRHQNYRGSRDLVSHSGTSVRIS
jgi:hypothetical protein